MSHPVNDQLYDRARDLMEVYTGGMQERILQSDLDRNDLESLRYHVSMFEAEQSIEDDIELYGKLRATFDEAGDVY